jgi:hypothetical protein
MHPFSKVLWKLTNSEIIAHCTIDEEIDFAGWDRRDFVRAVYVLRDAVILRDKRVSALRKEAKDGQALSE